MKVFSFAVTTQGANKTTLNQQGAISLYADQEGVKLVPYFWGVIEKTVLSPHSIPIPASKAEEISDIPSILPERLKEGVESIDIIIQKERENIDQGRFDPAIMVDRFYVHMRLRKGKEEDIFTVEQRILDLYVSKEFDDSYTIDTLPPEHHNCVDSYPNVRRLTQKIKDHTLKPKDPFAEIKVRRVIVQAFERVMESLGEEDASKYTLHIFERGAPYEEIDLSPEALEDVKRAAATIEYEPSKHIPEQIS